MRKNVMGEGGGARAQLDHMITEEGFFKKMLINPVGEGGMELLQRCAYLGPFQIGDIFMNWG